MNEAPDSPNVTLRQAVEAILLTSERQLSPAKIAEPLRELGFEAEPVDVERAVEQINESLERSGSVARIEKLAGGYRLVTVPEVGQVLASFHGGRAATRLSRAALETLSIVAYRQPITRAEIEAIRGVAAGEVLRSLLERRLVTVAGRAEELGRPMLYGTTPEFLKQFGLAKIGDLPAMEGVSA